MADPMDLLNFCHWLERTPGPVAIRESRWNRLAAGVSLALWLGVALAGLAISLQPF